MKTHRQSFHFSHNVFPLHYRMSKDREGQVARFIICIILTPKGLLFGNKWYAMKVSTKGSGKKLQKMLVAVWPSQSSRAPGQGGCGEGPGGSEGLPCGSPVPGFSSLGTAGVEAADSAPSSDLLLATEGSSALTSLIRNHQFTFISAETRKGPTFTFHSGLCTERAALEDVSLPSALLQFNFACKLNLPPGIC